MVFLHFKKREINKFILKKNNNTNLTLIIKKTSNNIYCQIINYKGITLASFCSFEKQIIKQIHFFKIKNKIIILKLVGFLLKKFLQNNNKNIIIKSKHKFCGKIKKLFLLVYNK